MKKYVFFMLVFCFCIVYIENNKKTTQDVATCKNVKGEYMTYNKMKKTIEDLSRTQGFYGRLLERIIEIENNEPFNLIALEDLARQFNDTVDLVLFFEQ